MKAKIKEFFIKLVRCHVLQDHVWTTPLLERNCKIDKELIEEVGVVEAFARGTIMYCKRCGYIPPVSVNAYNKMTKK